jgi:tetratricopeptide (TPR) repeat protein
MAILILSLILTLGGCGKKTEVNSFTTPNRDFSSPIGLSDDLVQSFPGYAEAKTAMDNEDWESAAVQLQALMAGPSPHAAFANDLGVVEIRRENYEEALKAFNQSIVLDPEYERAFFNKGTVLSQLDKRKEAIAAYKAAVALNDYYYEAWYNLGLLYYQKGSLSAAKKAFLAITEQTRSSRFNNAYYQLGLIAADQGNDPEAIKYYSESLLLDPSHVPSYINQAAAFLRLKELDKAYELLQNATALAPDSFRAYYNLGLVLRRLDRFEEAKDAYTQAVTLQPDSRKAWLNLGYVYAFLNEDENALAAFLRAMEIDPFYENAQKAISNLEAGQIQP